MKRIQILLLAILILISGIGIVCATDYPLIVQKTHDITPVNPGDTFTYTMTITNPYDMNFFEPGIFDNVPEGLEVISCSACSNKEGAPHVEWEGICQDLAPHETIVRTITVRLQPDTAGKKICNTVSIFGGEASDHSGTGHGSAEDCFSVPETAPEFPSTFLPMTLVIGFLGAVLYIQRTRKL